MKKKRKVRKESSDEIQLNCEKNKKKISYSTKKSSAIAYDFALSGDQSPKVNPYCMERESHVIDGPSEGKVAQFLRINSQVVKNVAEFQNLKPLQKQYKEAKANEFKSPDITLRKTPMLKDEKYVQKRKLASSFYKPKAES